MNKRSVPDEVVLFFIPVVLCAGITILFWMGSGTRESLRELMSWLGRYCPLRAELVPCCVLLVLFLSLHCALAPFHLTHTRLDREKVKVTPWIHTSGAFSTYAVMFAMFILLMDAVSIFLLAWTLDDESGPWETKRAFLIGVVTPAGIAIAAAVGLWLNHLILRLAMAAFGSLIRSPLGRGNGIRGDRKWETLSTGFHIIAVLYGGVFVGAAVVFDQNSFVLAIVVCFLIVRVIMNGVFEFVSFLLDWSNDRWIRRLAREFAEGTDPHSRLEAGGKLVKLGKWVAPAEEILLPTLRDSDLRIRTMAREILNKIAGVST